MSATFIGSGIWPRAGQKSGGVASVVVIVAVAVVVVVVCCRCVVEMDRKSGVVTGKWMDGGRSRGTWRGPGVGYKAAGMLTGGGGAGRTWVGS